MSLLISLLETSAAARKAHGLSKSAAFKKIIENTSVIKLSEILHPGKTLRSIEEEIAAILRSSLKSFPVENYHEATKTALSELYKAKAVLRSTLLGFPHLIDTEKLLTSEVGDPPVPLFGIWSLSGPKCIIGVNTGGGAFFSDNFPKDLVGCFTGVQKKSLDLGTPNIYRHFLGSEFVGLIPKELKDLMIQLKIKSIFESFWIISEGKWKKDDCGVIDETHTAIIVGRRYPEISSLSPTYHMIGFFEPKIWKSSVGLQIPQLM